MKTDSRMAGQDVVLGKIKVMFKNITKIKKIKVEDSLQEIQRFHTALEEAKKQLEEMYEKAKKEVGESGAAIFEAHKMLLEDESYIGIIEGIVKEQKVNAEYAVVEATEKVAALFANMSDDYFKERAEDVNVVSEKLILNLTGKGEKHISWKEPSVLITDKLTAGELLSIGREKISAIVLTRGTHESHVAILAGMMGIPVMTGHKIEAADLEDGMEIILYISEKKIILQPSEEEKQSAIAKREEDQRQREALMELRGRACVTKSGKSVHLYANIGSAGEVEFVKENDAEGIGLFRSEFIYLGRKQAPDEEEQFQIYKKVAEEMEGRRVIIRTLDIGSDKEVSYLHLDEEANPALGYRGIRICLSNIELFKTQLRAIFRASVYGHISIMYPMIISTEEIEKIKSIVDEVKEELKEAGIPYEDVEEGIMIETPASVMMSDELAEMVDFFSIGTNDLIQYTMAIDRQNEKLESYLKPHHPAILKMIKKVSDSAHRAGKWCGICGELASDSALTEEFIEMGIDELSVVPKYILPLKKLICDMD